MAGINFVRRWVMGQMTKKADDGIMITLPDSSKVDLNVNITMDRLLRNGIDPDAFTNPQQVDNAINMLNSRMVERAIPANSAEGREITEKLFGKQKAPVFDLEGNRIPEGSGIMGGKSVKDLMDSGQVSKGARGMKKSKKVTDREMFQAANERLTSDVNSIIKNIKSMEPITAMKEANSVIGRKGKYKNLTPEQSKKILQDTEDHIFERNIPEEDFADGGRIGLKMGSEGDHVKKNLGYREREGDSMPMPMGLGIPPSGNYADNFSNQSLKTLTKKPEGITSTIPIEKSSSPIEKSSSPIEKSPASRFAGSIFDFTNIEDEEETENKADGGRIGFGGGGTMGSSDKGYQGGGRDKEGNVSGDAPGAAPGGPSGDGPEDKGNDHQNAVQAMVNAGYTAKEINSITNPSTLDKIKNSPYNNPFTRGVLRAGLYTLNPSIAGLDFRKALQLTNAYNAIKDELDAPLEEEDVTLGGITGMDISTLQSSPYENMAPQSMAKGGRAGFMAGGMGRRAFLKLMGGTGATIGAAKSGIFSGFGKGAGKEVAKEVVKQSAGTPPPYFFKLAEKIKMLGDDATATTDRTIAKTLKSKDGKSTYLLEEDVTSGDTIIKKINKESDEMITDVEIMELKKGEVVKGKDGKPVKTPDNYEEVTEANARIEGDTFNDPYYSDGIEIDDILREVDDIPVPKASGGIARMLGE